VSSAERWRIALAGWASLSAGRQGGCKTLIDDKSKMKKIIFVRHGKAEDPVAEFPDFERSLTSKGKNISRLMALKLKEKEKNLGNIVTSPAFRAMETALIFAGIFAFPPEKMIINSNLYFNIDQNSFTGILKNTEEDVDIITLFGHNPSFTELPELLSKEGFEILPKSGIICLSFKTKTWSGVSLNTGFTEYFLNPKKVL
jgi:phosphohistidine phosphatase